MRASLLIILLFFSWYSSFAQKETLLEVVRTQTMTVNSYTSMTGTTRRVIPVTLPANTIRWFYSFSAYRDNQQVQAQAEGYNLLSKLSYLLDYTGTTAAALSHLTQPPGSNSADVFVIPTQQQSIAFSTKQDDYWRYDPNASRQGLNSGIIDVEQPSIDGTTVYLGLRNPSMMYAVNVTLQVVAVVRSVATSNGWTAAQRQQLYTTLKNHIRKVDTKNQVTLQQENAIADCTVTSLTQSRSFSDVQALAEFEIEKILTQYLVDCAKTEDSKSTLSN